MSYTYSSNTLYNMPNNADLVCYSLNNQSIQNHNQDLHHSFLWASLFTYIVSCFICKEIYYKIHADSLRHVARRKMQGKLPKSLSQLPSPAWHPFFLIVFYSLVVFSIQTYCSTTVLHLACHKIRRYHYTMESY